MQTYILKYPRLGMYTDINMYVHACVCAGMSVEMYLCIYIHVCVHVNLVF